MLLFTVPLVMVIDLAVWAIVVRLTKTASIGSLVLVVITIPLLLWQGISGWAVLWLGLTIGLIVWRHKGNIQRMVKGSEEKVPA